MLVGVITAFIVLVVIYGYVAFRPVPPIEADFGPEKLSFPVATPPDEAFKVIEALPASARQYKLGRADASKRRVILTSGMTNRSFGYFYPVDIAPAAAGSEITVGIKSKYPLQFGPIVRKQRQTQHALVIADIKAKLAGVI
jgi:hypothetical protein